MSVLGAVLGAGLPPPFLTTLLDPNPRSRGGDFLRGDGVCGTAVFFAQFARYCARCSTVSLSSLIVALFAAANAKDMSEHVGWLTLSKACLAKWFLAILRLSTLLQQ